MSTKSQQQSKKNECDIRDYDHRIELVPEKAKKGISKQNFISLHDCDKSMIVVPLSKDTNPFNF